MGTKLIGSSGADFAQQTQHSANPPESSDLTPKAFTGARSAPVGAAEGRAYAFGVKSSDSVPGCGLRGGFAEFGVC